MKMLRSILVFPFKALSWIAFSFLCVFMAAWSVIERDAVRCDANTKPRYKHER